MKGLMIAVALMVVSLVAIPKAQAACDGPGLAPLQARRVALQNVRFGARQGRSQAVRVAPLRIAPLVVPGCVGGACQSRTIIIR